VHKVQPISAGFLSVWRNIRVITKPSVNDRPKLGRMRLRAVRYQRTPLPAADPYL
jgi:hypothetical protein